MILLVVFVMGRVGWDGLIIPQFRRQRCQAGYRCAIVIVDFDTAVQDFGVGCVDHEVHLAAPIGGKADGIGVVLFDEVHDRQGAAHRQFYVVLLRCQGIGMPDDAAIRVGIVHHEHEQDLLHVRGQIGAVQTKIDGKTAVFCQSGLRRPDHEEEGQCFKKPQGHVHTCTLWLLEPSISYLSHQRQSATWVNPFRRGDLASVGHWSAIRIERLCERYDLILRGLLQRHAIPQGCRNFILSVPQ